MVGCSTSNGSGTGKAPLLGVMASSLGSSGGQGDGVLWAWLHATVLQGSCGRMQA